MEHVAIENEREMYETMLKISKRVEIMYETLQKETEEKERLQIQLWATEEALEELKHNKQSSNKERWIEDTSTWREKGKT